MMLNLFMVFDPALSYFSLNWISFFIFMLLVPQLYWLMKSRFMGLFILVLSKLWEEFSLLSGVLFNINNLLLFISLWVFIFFNNFFGLMPYVFTSTSHLSVVMGVSLSIWLGFMLFGWLMNTQFMFSHLVPLGTPFMLMFFMVLIETLSNIIRPLTLAVRLVANMIAGHLLLTLLSSFIPELLVGYLVVLVLQLLLLLLEVGVSLIQSYVFVVLMVLYMKETNYDKF